MDLITGIVRLTALGFLITGLSHITAPRAWTRFFIAMRERGEVAGRDSGQARSTLSPFRSVLRDERRVGTDLIVRSGLPS